MGKLGTQQIIAIGFTLVLILLVALTGLGLSHMATIRVRMVNLVTESNVKTESVYLMRSVSRERFASLGQMVVLHDPFERDDEYMRFQAQATEFIRARDRSMAQHQQKSDTDGAPQYAMRENGGDTGHDRLLRFLDLELGLQLLFDIADLELDVFWFRLLIENESRAPSVITLMRSLAGEYRDQLMLAGAQVAEIQPVHATAQQGGILAFGVQIVRHDLVIQLELHRVELEKLAHIHGQEYRDLSAGRKQQLLFEHEQIAIEFQHLLLQALNLSVQTLELGRTTARFLRGGHRRGRDGQQAEQQYRCQ
jgi:hypothetical protein